MPKISKNMAEELTSLMQYEFWSNKMSKQQYMTIAAQGAINQGMSKKDACRKFGVTEKFFDENFEKALQIIIDS